MNEKREYRFCTDCGNDECPNNGVSSMPVKTCKAWEEVKVCVVCGGRDGHWIWCQKLREMDMSIGK